MSGKKTKMVGGVKQRLISRKMSGRRNDIDNQVIKKNQIPNQNEKTDTQKRLDEVEDEHDDFDSEMADGPDGPLLEEETTDEKRIRLAKQVINDAKMLRKREELERDDDNEDEALTGILQNGIVGGS